MKNELTKREYIAALALQGILAAIPKDELKYSFEQVLPKLAVMYADELLVQFTQAIDDPAKLARDKHSVEMKEYRNPKN